MGIFNTCRLKNNTGSPATFRGQIIAAGAYYEITDVERYWWAQDTVIAAAITAGTLIVNDGAIDLSVADGFELLRLNYTADASRIKNVRVDDTVKEADYVLTFKKATPANPKNDRIQFTKIADVGGSGRAIEISFMKDEGKPFIRQVGNTYSICAYIFFPGTGNVGSPASVSVVAGSEIADTNTDYRLVDYTNSIVIAEKIGATTIFPSKVSMPLVGAFPINSAILDIECKKGSAPNSPAILGALEILF